MYENPGEHGLPASAADAHEHAMSTLQTKFFERIEKHLDKEM